MVTLANNHAMDQGKEGLSSTLQLLRQNNIAYVGAGLSETEKSSTAFVSIKDKTFAFVNCCENEWSTSFDDGTGCNPLDEVSLFYEIQEAKLKADYCVVIIHGGHEMYQLPSPRMKKLYRWFIDVGADAVIGHHPHCYSGRELYKGKNIVYSLGNFLFDHPTWTDGPWTEACACILEFSDAGIHLRMIPFTQCNNQVGIHLLNDEENLAFAAADAAKTAIIQDDAKLSEEFSNFISKQSARFDYYIEPLSCRLYKLFRRLHLVPSILSSKKRLLLLNLVRCESHRDILTNHLRNSIKGQ